MKLTRNEKNEHIAKACGWKMSAHGWWSHDTLPDNGGAMDEPPDYFNDLNACHEMERVVLIAPFSGPENDTASGSERLCIQLESYEENLYNQYIGMGSRWHYTAAQRAEAFGLTLNLWKEGE